VYSIVLKKFNLLRAIYINSNKYYKLNKNNYFKVSILLKLISYKNCSSNNRRPMSSKNLTN
jgi:hypothetical protein